MAKLRGRGLFGRIFRLRKSQQAKEQQQQRVPQKTNGELYDAVLRDVAHMGNGPIMALDRQAGMFKFRHSNDIFRLQRVPTADNPNAVMVNRVTIKGAGHDAREIQQPFARNAQEFYQNIRRLNTPRDRVDCARIFNKLKDHAEIRVTDIQRASFTANGHQFCILNTPQVSAPAAYTIVRISEGYSEPFASSTDEFKQKIQQLPRLQSAADVSSRAEHPTRQHQAPATEHQSTTTHQAYQQFSRDLAHEFGHELRVSSRSPDHGALSFMLGKQAQMKVDCDIRPTRPSTQNPKGYVIIATIHAKGGGKFKFDSVEQLKQNIEKINPDITQKMREGHKHYSANPEMGAGPRGHYVISKDDEPKEQHGKLPTRPS